MSNVLCVCRFSLYGGSLCFAAACVKHSIRMYFSDQLSKLNSSYSSMLMLCLSIVS